MATVTIYSDFGTQENKVCHRFHCFAIYLPWSDGTGCHDLCFLNVEFKPAFSLSFTFIKQLFSSSLLSAIKVVSSAYLRLLLFLSAIFHVCLVAQSCPICDPMDCSPPGSSVHKDSPGKNTGMGCYALLQGVFPTQGSNPHCRQILYWLSHHYIKKNGI